MGLASLHPKAPLLVRKMKKKTGERARDGTGQSPAPIGLALYPKAPQRLSEGVRGCTGLVGAQGYIRACDPLHHAPQSEDDHPGV